MAGLLMTQRTARPSSRGIAAGLGIHRTASNRIGDPTLMVGLSFAAITAKYFAGEMTETLRLAQRAIDLADGDPTKGNLIVGSPLASRSTAGPVPDGPWDSRAGETTSTRPSPWPVRSTRCSKSS